MFLCLFLLKKKFFSTTGIIFSIIANFFGIILAHTCTFPSIISLHPSGNTDAMISEAAGKLGYEKVRKIKYMC